MSKKAKKDDESGTTENQVLSKLEAMEKKVNERIQRLESSLVTVQSQISNKLESIERKINVRIDNVESSLKKIEESSILSTDDQLFFGFVFSLALLILALPEFDVCTLFESFGVKIEAAQGFITTKDLTVIALILASSLRYLVIFAKGDVKKSKLRITSVSLLVTAVYILMTDLFIRGLGTALENVYVFSMLFAPVALTLFAVLFGSFVEKKWYQHYHDIDEPFVSLTFAIMGLYILVVYELGIAVAIFIPISDIVAFFIIVASAFITFLIYMFIKRVQRWSKQKQQKKQT